MLYLGMTSEKAKNVKHVEALKILESERKTAKIGRFFSTMIIKS
jgi:hypothetical protein